MPLWLEMVGHCGIEKLKYKNDIVVPIPKNDELFIRVKGAGINNTDINTIIGLGIDEHTIPTKLDKRKHCLFYGYDDVGRWVSYGRNSAGDMGSYFTSFCSHSPSHRLTDVFLDRC